jgi:hypothetical protein
VFFGKDVSGVAFATDVKNVDLLVFMNSFTDSVLADIGVAHILVAGCLGPVDGALVVVIDGGWRRW